MENVAPGAFVADAPAALPPPPDAAAVEMSATTIAGAVEALSVMLLGPDMVHDKDERNAAAATWKNYLASQGGVALPPGVAVAAFYALVISKRAAKPTLQERCTLWLLRIKKLFTRGAR